MRDLETIRGTVSEINRGYPLLIPGSALPAQAAVGTFVDIPDGPMAPPHLLPLPPLSPVPVKEARADLRSGNPDGEAREEF